jgi:putative ABC transport system permease protein
MEPCFCIFSCRSSVRVPNRQLNSDGTLNPAEGGTFLLRTGEINSLALAPTLRRLVTQTNPAFRVSNIQTQQELLDNQTIRERLLASLANIARIVTAQIFVTAIIGAAVGIALGMASVRYVQTLLFGVKVTDPSMLIAPAAALLAAVPAVLRAARIDPSIMLRTE